MGSRPKMVVSDVIRIGRSRCRPPRSRASVRVIPSLRKWFTWSMSTMALLTASPDRTMTPRYEFVFSVVPDR